jgi:hypothetical protein
MRRNGKVTTRWDSAEQRFWSKVDKAAPNGCWHWLGYLDKGYGKFNPTRDETVGAHRFSYRLLKGEIPEGLDLDHLCVNPRCVNPDHLEPVTSAENTRRAGMRITQCLRGHDYTYENTYVAPGTGRKSCVTCRRAALRKYYRKKAALR